MEFTTWEPVYKAICTDMGYARAADEHARDRLAELVIDSPTIELDGTEFEGETVAIAAPGPPLERELDLVREADRLMAAGIAADRLFATGIEPDWIVTDLDGHAERVPDFTRCGPNIAVHAHGDNLDLLETTIPECDLAAVLPTTQAAPTRAVINFGGFTDGDRAAFLADALGATELTFPGWELIDMTLEPVKRRKLNWAAKLLTWLEHRRGEQFSVLDEVRPDLDRSAIPGPS